MQSIFIKNRRNHTNLTTTWEQRKLGELSETTYGGGTPNTSNLEYWNGDIPWIQSSDIVEHQLYGTEPKKYITQTGLSKSATKLIPANSIAIVTRVGVGKLGVMPFSYTSSQDFLSLSNLNVDIDFGAYLIYKKIQSELNAVQGTSIKGVTKEELLKKKVLVPSKEEQRQIGTYFRNLDNLITLHQRKYSLLFIRTFEILKEACFFLNVNAWEQRKLGDVASNFEYGLNASAKEFDGENKYIRITDIDDESRVFLSDDITSPDTDLISADKYKLEKGDILFARTGASVGKTYLYREKDGLVYYAGFLIRAKINPENDAEFVFQNTLTDSYDSFIRITSQRSGQPGVNAQEYQGFSFYVPSLKEQQLIGTYFKNLDSLITLHQRKPFQRKNGGKNYVRRC